MRVVPLPGSLCSTADEVNALRERLSTRYKIEVSANFWGGRGYLRLCAQLYNTEADMDRLADAVGELAAQSLRRPVA